MPYFIVASVRQDIVVALQTSSFRYYHRSHPSTSVVRNGKRSQFGLAISSVFNFRPLLTHFDCRAVVYKPLFRSSVVRELQQFDMINQRTDTIQLVMIAVMHPVRPADHIDRCSNTPGKWTQRA